MPELAPSCCTLIGWNDHQPQIDGKGKSFSVRNADAGTDTGDFHAEYIARNRIVARNLPSVIKNQEARLYGSNPDQFEHIR